MNRNSVFSHIISILVLPFSVLVLVPVYLHFYAERKCCEIFDYVPDILGYFIGIPIFLLGLVLLYTTIRLFATRGKGTLAPWAPPAQLVVTGPYRHVRNPMICAVNFILIGIAFIFQDENILMWQIFFFVLNTVHFLLYEEPDLERRFGKDYVKYKNNVGRWIPRVSPWVSR